MTDVVITGVGIISSLGRGIEATLDSLRAAQSGIGLIRGIDTSAMQCRIGGEVRDAIAIPERGHDRFTRLALVAAKDAMSMSGDPRADPERVGVILGTGLGGCETSDTSYRRLYAEGGRIPPTAIPASMYNAASSAVATQFQARGVSWSVVSACASSAHAIGAAANAIRSAQADVVITGGSDAPLVPGIIRGWESLRVLAIDENPSAACRPFDASRKGLVLAEGAAVLVLESRTHAEKRGAGILGVIRGAGATSDAGHVTDPSSEGAGRAMALALRDAALEPSAIGYINAHGTATRANDPAEAKAIREIFGPAAPPVSSTKSLHGHAMGASGAIEIVASLLALREGFIPPTINLDRPDPACALDHVAGEPREARVRYFLSNSFGFGGMNASVAVQVGDGNHFA